MDFPCVVCGRYFTEDMVAAALLPEGKTDCRKDSYGDICPDCLAAGPEGAALECTKHADDLQGSAMALYLLANDIRAIPESDWKKPEDIHDVAKRVYDKILKQRGEFINEIVQETPNVEDVPLTTNDEDI